MDHHDNDALSDTQNEQLGEHLRIYLRGKTWYANYQFNKRQIRESLKTNNKKEARRRASRIADKLIAGEYQPAVVISNVQDAIDSHLTFLETDGRAPKTMVKFRHVFKRIAKLANDRNVKDLSGLDLLFIDAYRKNRTDDKAAPKTIYNELVILRQLILFALNRNLLEKDPQKGVRLKKPKPTRQPCWTREEVVRILKAANESLKPPLTLLAETGMRYAELAWLTWEDVDVKSNALRIRAKAGWKPKSGDERAVPLTTLAKETLNQLPRTWRWVVTMPPSLTHPIQGRQWTERRLLSGLKRLLFKLSLEGKLHTFRHSFVSNALLNGTPLAIVRQWVGHVDPRVTDIYTHVHDYASQDAMKRLAELNRVASDEAK